MKPLPPHNPSSPEDAGRSSRRFGLLGAAALLVIIVGLLLPREEVRSTGSAVSRAAPKQVDSAGFPNAIQARTLQPRSNSAPAGSAEEIVAGKLGQFARNRRALVHDLARHFKVAVPADVERFFAAIESGHWEEADAIFKSLRESEKNSASGRSEELYRIWRPIQETWGIARETRNWPAQKLLDYGEAVLGSLRPGMVYVGGTDPGCFIPTFLNETSEGERHIVLTQNALADKTYLDYLGFRYADRLATLTEEDSNRAFQNYIADAQKRLQHDQQFPDEPKQIRPGEQVKADNGRVQVSGQTAVLAINERLMQTLLEKNPDLSFALEESFPFKSTYANAAPLGPVMELSALDEQNAFTPERAAQTAEYWRATAQQLLSDPEAAGSFNTIASWSKMATAQANLLTGRNYTAEAEQAYRSALEIFPGTPDAATGLAEVLARTGRGEEARRLLDDFVQRNPTQRAFVDASRQALFPAKPPGKSSSGQP